ncbi:MAG: DegT/DnrJ/EryC1/StrS family aminotransferase [Nitrospirae bacterium]|nr:DegT/DnrJ/EryC1/StrS family aminotransferase [Nitrospirota bacterium]
MKIQMVDLKAQYMDIKDELDAVLGDVLASCHFILGPNVKALEDEVAEYTGTKHAVAVASGTDALHLALLATGIKPGDEVVTSPFTFIATAEAITYIGAKPVFVDIEEDTFNMDPALLAAAMTDRTKALLPVHLFGLPVKIGPILDFAVTHGLTVVEDCAQSFGANYKFSRTGCFGDAGCFSFFPSKNLGCYGDGGMITTDSDKVADELRSLRNHGSKVRYYHDTIGYNSRLDEIQAAILRVKLKRIDTYNMKRRERAALYNARLSEISGITTPSEPTGYFHVYHQYTILSEKRDQIMKALADAGIASAVYYPVPLHLQKCYAGLGYKKGDFPVTERMAERVLSLPMYPELPVEDVYMICDIIKSCI